MERDRTIDPPDHVLINGFRLRKAVPDDLDEIMQVEHACYPYPWPQSAFEGEFANRWSNIELVLAPEGKLAAFLVYWTVVDELHLLNIAVHPDFRRQGLGRKLMNYLESLCRRQRLTHIALEVRVSNMAALSLYSAQGYSIMYRRKKYYVEEGEDAFVMLKMVTGDPAAE